MVEGRRRRAESHAAQAGRSARRTVNKHPRRCGLRGNGSPDVRQGHPADACGRRSWWLGRNHHAGRHAAPARGALAALADLASRSRRYERLRLAGLATIVVGNLATLHRFRGGFRRSARPNRAFHRLLLAVCALSLTVLLVAPLNSAFGFPALDPRWILALLLLPAAWALWRLAGARGGARKA